MVSVMPVADTPIREDRDNNETEVESIDVIAKTSKVKEHSELKEIAKKKKS